jgi:cobalt-zinc-cadmium efflux system outer membrane protein
MFSSFLHRCGSLPLLGACFLFSLHAATPPPWTLEALQARALAENPELKFYEAEVAAAKGQRTQAGLWKNPEVSVNYGDRRTKDASGTLLTKGLNRGFSVSQTFEFPGKGSLRKAIADRDVEIAELGLRQFRLALGGQVRRAATDYRTASTLAETTTSVTERCAAMINLLQERPGAGVPQLLERRVIEASLVEFQRIATEAAQARDTARLDLNQLVGFPPNQPLSLALDKKQPISKPNLNALVLAGLSHNLLLKTREAELAKALREVSAAKLDVAPNFSIGPFYSQDRAGGSEENYGLTLSTTLPLWDWNQGHIATAESRRAQAESLRQDARRKVETEIVRHIRALEFLQQQLEQMPPDLLKSQREAANLADQSYRSGAINVQLFLEVQRQFLSAQQTHNTALAEVTRHQLELELLTGGQLP